jgi:hypothetical protein
MAIATLDRPHTGALRRVDIRAVDTDIHHGIREKDQLYPYLGDYYAARFKEYGGGPSGNLYAFNGGVQGYRADVYDVHKGGYANAVATSVEATVQHLFDECGIDLGVLTGSSVYSAACLPDLDYANALCRAFNEHTRDTWLAADSRFRYAMAICPQDPQAAAEEIDRFGSDPRVVGVLLPCGAPRAFGQRFYNPIFAACERQNLTVCIHFATEGTGVNPPPTSAGYPCHYIESRQARPSFYQAHLASMVFDGWFDRFPSLRVLMLEAGFAWVPAYVWKLDQDWKGLRYQVPWVKRLPSETVFERVRFATQPVEEPTNPAWLDHIVEWMQGEKTLMFASDYPHWDWDDPNQTFPTMKPELRRKVFADNALDWFDFGIE